MRLAVYVVRRVGIAILQVVAIEVLTFVILRVLPANPAYRIAGFDLSRQHIHQIEVQLGLNKPIWSQLWTYAVQLFHGQMGTSTSTGDSVAHDLAVRVPATLELVVIGMFLAIVIAVPLGMWSARARRGLPRRVVRAYSLLAGSQPDYWWALALVFVFFVVAKVAPGPVGQIGVGVSTPKDITGSDLLDSIITGNGAALWSVLSHLVLPIVTVVIVYAAPIVKMTASSYGNALQSESVRLMRASGVSERRVALLTLRLSAAPIVTTAGIATAYLLGGAVLIETVFGWNGIAQYAVTAAINSDYPAMEGAVLAIAAVAALIYLLTDLVQLALDPRARIGATR